MHKVNNKDTRTTLFGVFYVNLEQIFTPCFSAFNAEFKQVKEQWVEGLIIIIIIITAIQTFLQHVKLHDVENMCNYKDLQLHGTHLYIKYLREKIYNDCNNVALFLKFSAAVKDRCKTFQNITINVKRFQQSSLQERRLPILKFSQENPQNNFACCLG